MLAAVMEALSFHNQELVRNRQKRILTITQIADDGKVFVEEEPTPYLPFELEKIDQTNVVKFKLQY